MRIFVSLRSRRFAAGAGAIALLLALLAAGPASAQATSCAVEYAVGSEWSGGFTASVTINNSGATTINGWTVGWTFPSGQQISDSWNGTFDQSGSSVTVGNAAWNGTIASGGSASFGFIASFSGSNQSPSSFTVNGQTCGGDPGEPSEPGDPSEPGEPSEPPPGNPGDPVWESSDQWATWNTEGYILYNNIWGSGAGSQSIWANSYRNWGVHANHPDTGGVKSYPNATRPVNRQLSSLNSLTSTFDVSVPSAGAYTSTYDIWADNHSYEIMIWMNQFGPVGPIGSYQTSATVGGHSFDVYRGVNGSFEVFSFLRTSNADAGTVDLLAIMRWLQQRGWFGNVTIGDVQFGYEITSSSGGMDFTTNDFSVSFN